MENNQNVNQNQNTNERSQQEKYSELKSLLANNLGIEPRAVVYSFPSERIEDSILRWLEQKGGIDTSNMSIRCVLKKNVGFSNILKSAADKTGLPFIVVLFKAITNQDLNVEGGIGHEAKNNISHALNNFHDQAQITVKNNPKLNSLISGLTSKGNVKWKLIRKRQTIYTVLDSDKVMCVCFAKKPEEVNQYLFDFIGEPKVRRNMNKNQDDFYITVALSKMRARKHPKIDPMNFIR